MEKPLKFDDLPQDQQKAVDWFVQDLLADSKHARVDGLVIQSMKDKYARTPRLLKNAEDGFRDHSALSEPCPDVESSGLISMKKLFPRRANNGLDI